MLKCMFYKRTERDLQRRRLRIGAELSAVLPHMRAHSPLDKWLKTPGDGMRRWLELLVNKFRRNSLANYKIHHIYERRTHKRMQIIYFIWGTVRRQKELKKNKYKNYHNNFELSVCGWTAGNTIAWHLMQFCSCAILSYDAYNHSATTGHAQHLMMLPNNIGWKQFT